jgi:colanic acid biosynthesis glycosyl transferase WcaI
LTFSKTVDGELSPREAYVGAATALRRILIYGMNYAPEPIGVGRYSGELGAYLAKEGFLVDVVTASPHYPGWAVRGGYGNRYTTEYIDGARVTHCPLLLTRKMQGIRRAVAPFSFALSSAPVAIWRAITLRPGTVLCVEPTLFAAPAGLLAAKFCGARAVLHVQDLEIDAAFGVHHLKGRLLKWLSNVVENRLLRSFDAVVTISGRMGDKLKDKGVRPDRLSLVRNWVDLDKIKPMDRPSSYRAELGLSARRFVALYAGNVGAKQALNILLDAAEKLVGEPDIVFVVVGDGPVKAGLVARYGRLPNVRFLPVQPEERLCDLLNLADVHVLPQDRGAADLVLPSKLGGMLASGKPCIVMADPGTELYEFLQGVVALLPPGDADALAKAVSALFRDPARQGAQPQIHDLSSLAAQHNLDRFKAVLTQRMQG